jgi:hypothetical protein
LPKIKPSSKIGFSNYKKKERPMKEKKERELGTEDNWIKAKFSLLDPEKIPPTNTALVQLESRVITKEQTLWKKVFAPRYRSAWAAIVVVGILAISLSIPQVRVIANSFLGLFRVEQIEAVDVGITLENLPQEMETRFSAVDNIIGDQITIDKKVTPVEVNTIVEASKLAGFQARMPGLPVGETHIFFQDSTTIRLVIDQARWQALLEGMGYDDFVIPESADGAEVTFNLPAAVIVGIGDCEYNQISEIKLGHPETENCTVYLQSRTPTIEAPPGLDINRAGQILLQALGMTAEQAEEFSSTVNWATTLVVPVPSDIKYHKIKVEGVEGIFLEDEYARGKSVYSLLWLKDGILNALIGDGSLVEALESINSLE